MKTLATTIAALAALVPSTGLATGVPVVDAAHIAVHEVHNTLDYIEQTIMQSEAVQQTLNQFDQLMNEVEMIYNQYEQIQGMYTELARLGDPAAITDLIGLDSTMSRIDSLQDIGEFSSLSRSARGSTVLEWDGEGLFGAIGDRFETMEGSVSRNEALYRPQAVIVDRVNQYKAIEEEVLAEKAVMLNDLQSLGEQLKSATTDAEVQKLNGSISVVNTGIAEANAKLVAAKNQIEAQQAEIEAMEKAASKARLEALRAQMSQREAQALDAFAPVYGSGGVK